MAEDRAESAPISELDPAELARQHRRHVAGNLVRFTLCGFVIAAISTLVLVVDDLLSGAGATAFLAVQAGILGTATVLVRRAPSARPVPLVAAAACVAVAFSLTVLFTAVGADGALLGFMLLILAVAAALLFAWPLPASIAVIVAVLAPWLVVSERLKYVGSLAELRGAIVVGALIYLAIAVHTTRTFRRTACLRWKDREAARALAASRDAYRDLAETARDLIFATDLQARFTYVNPALAAFLGEPTDVLIGRSSYDFVTSNPENPALADIVEGRVRRDSRSPVVVEMQTVHGLRWVETTLTDVRDGFGRLAGVRGISRDITERHQAEQALREATERFNLALEAAGVGTWSWSVAQDAVRWDDSICTLFGRSPGDYPTSYEEFLALVHPDDREELRRVVSRAVEEGAEYNSEFRIIRPDGSVPTIAARGAMWRTAEGAVDRLTGVCWDVTAERAANTALHTTLEDLRRSEERIRTLARRQAVVREEERKRLSFDLHDNVCQELVGIGILIASARQSLPAMPAKVAQDLDHAVRYLNEIGEHLRLLAHDLRPMALYDLGLEGSLRALAQSMSSEDTRIGVDVRSAVPRLAEDVEIVVYRIAQEAVTNAVRHARCANVDVVLEMTGDTLELEIRDDGCGFVVEARRPAACSGLLSMEERALAIGGRIEVSSRVGRGTTVRLVCPAGGEAARGVG